jgi:putative Mg2+ transporter-C (MgtC) family protein
MDITAADVLVGLDPLVLASRLGAAAAAGLVIGLDRELRGKSAGLRTMMLVSLAAAMFVVLTAGMAQDPSLRQDHIRADPIRVVEAVVTGVAFLGAGSIIQARGAVRGLTTGASIWMVGAIGAACGAGLFHLAATGTAIAFLILTVLGFVERRLTHRHDHRDET